MLLSGNERSDVALQRCTRPATHDVFDAERVEDKKARNPKKALPRRAGPFHWGE